ncbi:hypothetical protein C8D76_10238 [Pasteurella langaaensis DSM 22999]|uniref:Lipoprotein n=1 Tax=Alitibacter langaaensis DSM 22999 TaxID=1122935 RepID=A0A2U0TCL3_9PAST|nr:hypothetical protein [Pasteurella langaaensis]PVX41342.1 hypothetical protein C8D76_10238 [Pasteurella langaaensis DSM 22999]
MKKLFAFFSTGLAVLLLSGCTALLWEMSPIVKTHDRERDDGIDTLIAFGRTQADKAPLQKGQVVMMGERYWYVVDRDISDYLLPILTINLPQPYTLTNNKGKRLTELPVTRQENNRFESNLCLNYTPQNATETAQLTSRKFELEKLNKSGIYSRCITVKGMIYSKPTGTQADYHFQTRVPIKLTFNVKTTELNAEAISANIMLTPLTLAIDLIWIPLYMIDSAINTRSN